MAASASNYNNTRVEDHLQPPSSYAPAPMQNPQINSSQSDSPGVSRSHQRRINSTDMSKVAVKAPEMEQVSHRSGFEVLNIDTKSILTPMWLSSPERERRQEGGGRELTSTSPGYQLQRLHQILLLQRLANKERTSSVIRWGPNPSVAEITMGPFCTLTYFLFSNVFQPFVPAYS